MDERFTVAFVTCPKWGFLPKVQMVTKYQPGSV
jgi:hypothetical protein